MSHPGDRVLFTLPFPLKHHTSLVESTPGRRHHVNKHVEFSVGTRWMGGSDTKAKLSLAPVYQIARKRGDVDFDIDVDRRQGPDSNPKGGVGDGRRLLRLSG
jgi:hypothetical protein